MEKELKILGVIDKDGYELANRVYSREGVRTVPENVEQRSKRSKEI